jgi:hypothetical protein
MSMRHLSTAVARPAAVLVAAIALSLLPSQLAQSASSYQVPGTIASNCSADVTGQLSSWFATVPDNSVITFAAGGCYRIEGMLELTNRHGLTFDGNGATLKATTVVAARPQWRIDQGSDYVLENMTIDGGDATPGVFDSALQHSHGIELMGPANVDINHVTIKNVYGDCVYVGQGYYNLAWSTNVHLHDSSCVGAGRQGVALTAGSNVLIERTTFSNIGRTVFDIEPNGAGFGVTGVTFANNRVQGAELFDALGDGPVDSISVLNNVITGVGTHMQVQALPGQRHSNIAINGNVSSGAFSNPGSVAIDAVRVDGLTVTGNTIPLGAVNMALVDASESCSVTVSGNTFSGGVTEARIHSYTGCTYTTPLVSTAPAPTNATTTTTTTSTPTTTTTTTPTSGGTTTTTTTTAPTKTKPSKPSLKRSASAVAASMATIAVPKHQRRAAVRRKGLLVRFHGSSSVKWSFVATTRAGTKTRVIGRATVQPSSATGAVRLHISRATLAGARRMVIQVHARVRVGGAVISVKTARATVDSP